MNTIIDLARYYKEWVEEEPEEEFSEEAKRMFI
jgi:hypothetical protein